MSFSFNLICAVWSYIWVGISCVCPLTSFAEQFGAGFCITCQEAVSRGGAVSGVLSQELL